MLHERAVLYRRIRKGTASSTWENYRSVREFLREGLQLSEKQAILRQESNKIDIERMFL